MAKQYTPTNLRLGNLLAIQSTDQYFKVKIWRLHTYFSRHPLSIRGGGIERSYRKKKRLRLKNRILEERRCCEICGTPLTWGTASIHHIIHRRADPSKEFDPGNLQLLCRECHVRLHQIEQLTNQLNPICNE